MSVICPECSAVTRGVSLHDADGERVFAYCDVCGFATVEHTFSTRRATGAFKFVVPSPPGLDGITGAAASKVVMSFSSY